MVRPPLPHSAGRSEAALGSVSSSQVQRFFSTPLGSNRQRRRTAAVETRQSICKVTARYHHLRRVSALVKYKGTFKYLLSVPIPSASLNSYRESRVNAFPENCFFVCGLCAVAGRRENDSCAGSWPQAPGPHRT